MRQQKNKVSKHTQCTQTQVIYFQIEAPKIDFKYFQLSNCISNLASQSDWLIYWQISFDYTHKNTGSFNNNKSTIAQNRNVMALEKLNAFLITTDLSFPTGQNIFIFTECLGWR